MRLVPQWYADGGPISIHYASRTQLPAKTQAAIAAISGLTPTVFMTRVKL